MAKRSTAKAIGSKQTSAYKGVTRLTPVIHHIDGSSKREVSRSPRIEALRSWTIASGFASEDAKDAQAEKAMNPQGWTKRRNPVCPGCFIQKALNGSCDCNA